MSVAKIWKKWRARQSLYREFSALDPAQREELARDNGVDRSTLESLSAQRSWRGNELERLMGALALDIGRIKRTYPAAFRDMSIVCSECIAYRRCRDRLDDGTARQAYAGYCPNALTLNALSQKQASVRLAG